MIGIKFYQINNHRDYRISTKGIVIDSNSQVIKPINVAGLMVFKLNDMIVSGPQLVWETFIGENTYPIKYKDCHTDNIAIKNLKVDIDIRILSENEFLINGILYTRIPGFSEYVISRNGTVFSLKRKIFMIKNFNENGYPTVAIVNDSGYRSPKKVHRLVYSTYIGKLLDDHVIDHIDANIFNSSTNNLQQISSKINSDRAVILENANREWTESQVRIICDGITKNKSNDTILADLGIPISYENSRKLISLTHLLRNRKIYASIANEYRVPSIPTAVNKRDKVLNESSVREIRELYKNGESIKSLSERYHCTTSTITKVTSLKTWKFVV